MAKLYHNDCAVCFMEPHAIYCDAKLRIYCYTVKVMHTLEKATKTQRGSMCVALLFL